jgi:hypothetical protein
MCWRIALYELQLAPVPLARCVIGTLQPLGTFGTQNFTWPTVRVVKLNGPSVV